MGGAAALVYSGADEAFERWHTREVPSRRTRGLAEEFKQFGEPYWVGVWAALALVDHVLARTAVSRFGRRCLEASVIGLPVLWSTQRLLGSSRPSDGNGPGFRPFHDENAASGHTFIAAVPLLVLARDHNPTWLRTLSGALSPVTGWTRLHDRRHYLSQVLLGWTIAWKAAGAVLDGEESASRATDEASHEAADVVPGGSPDSPTRE